MHPNLALLNRLFTALDRHDHAAMAACYHPNATFHDIAFDLRGRDEIHRMWEMICAGDIHARFEVLHVDDRSGHVDLVDTYTFGRSTNPPKPGRPVRNVIDAKFRFQDGLIIEHRDACDAREWASQAIGGPAGFLAGRLRFLRSRKARQKLDAFARSHSQPA